MSLHTKGLGQGGSRSSPLSQEGMLNGKLNSVLAGSMGHNKLFESEVFQSYQGAAAAGGNTFMIGMPHEGPCPMVHVKPRGHQMASAFMHAGL